MADGAALIPGLTQTSEDTGSPLTRLTEVLSRRKGASTEKVAQAMSLLEDAFASEENDGVKKDLAMALTILREGTPRASSRS